MALKRHFFCALYLFLYSTVYSQTDTSRVFTIVEQNPEFPGGQAAFYKYLGQNIKYSQSLKGNGIDCASIYVKFIVEKDGSISHVEVIRGCKDEAYNTHICQIIQNMPRWKPGKQEGKLVRVSYSIPIRIHLE